MEHAWWVATVKIEAWPQGNEPSGLIIKLTLAAPQRMETAVFPKPDGGPALDAALTQLRRWLEDRAASHA